MNKLISNGKDRSISPINLWSTEYGQKWSTEYGGHFVLQQQQNAHL